MQKVSYMGDGSTTEFNFNFPYFENSNIVVTKNNVAATGYSIIGTSAGQNADIPYTGGKVVFETAPIATDSIIIMRQIPLTRVVDYQPTELITPTALNQDINYLIEVLKDMQDKLDIFSTQYSEIVDKESTDILLEKIDTVSQQIIGLGDITTLRQDVTTNTGNITTLNTRTSGLIDYVIESQNPTSENGYKWYRKYKSGWIEQGGKVSGTSNATLPKKMADRNYSVIATCRGTGSTYAIGINLVSENVLYINCGNYDVDWYVCGIADQS